MSSVFEPCVESSNGTPVGAGSGGGSGTVSTNATLTGDGSSGSPLAVVQSYVALTGTQTAAGAKTWSNDATFSGKIIGATVGPASGQQHTLPAVTSDTVALIAASQNLANKTITSAALTGTHTGNTTLSGQVTFSNGTAPIISATIGPSSTQQHALPAVTSSTVAVLGAAQSWTGVQTFTAAPIAAVDDATTNAVTDVISVRHTTSGTAANNIAAGILYQTEDTAGNVQDTARIAGLLITATSGSEVGGIDFQPWSGGALTQRMRLGGDGGLLVGNTLALGAVGIGLLRDIAIYGGNAANNGYTAMLQMVAGTQVTLGTSSTTCSIQASAINAFSFGGITLTCSSQATGVLSSTTAQWGTGDAGASAANYTHRGANITGTDANGKTLTWRAPLGTGAGTAGVFRIEGGQVGTTGTTVHSTVTYADFQDTATDGEAAFLIRVKKGGSYTTERVTLVAGASVAASGRNFLSVS